MPQNPDNSWSADSHTGAPPPGSHRPDGDQPDNPWDIRNAELLAQQRATQRREVSGKPRSAETTRTDVEAAGGGRVKSTDRKRRGAHKTLISGLIGGLGGATLMLWALTFTGALWGAGEPPPVANVPNDVVVRVISPQIDIENGVHAAMDLSAVAAKAAPSVVTVHALDDGSSGNTGLIAVSTGSGVVMEVDGAPYVVTNAHVVNTSSTYSVVLADGRTYDGTLLGTDETTDIGVLSIPADALTAIEEGTSDSLTIGDAVAAIGNPLGLEGGPTVTGGSLSAVGRRVQVNGAADLVGMLQTDAAITHGSSGGALVDSEGRLVGITTAIAVTDEGPSGLGFAVPVEVVLRVVNDIVDSGAAEYPYLGLQIGTGALHLDDGGVLPIGAEVYAVVKGGAADRSGIAVGDIIVAIEGHSVQSADSLLDRLARYSEGDIISLTVRTDEGDQQVVELELAGRPDSK